MTFLRLYIWVTLTSLLFNSSVAQDSLILKRLNISNTSQIALDEFYNLYIATSVGSIYKYDKSGNFLVSYSPSKPQQIYSIEAFNTVRIFCFYKDLQEFNYFDRFLTFENAVKFSSDAIGYARVASISSDNSIWVFDETDYTLKKYDPILQKITQNISCNMILEDGNHNISYLKEFQNKLYIVDKNLGIYIFDNMGNLDKYIPIPYIQEISFYSEELYALCKDKVLIYNLYDKFNIKEKLMPSDGLNYLVSDKYIYVSDTNGVNIYKK